MSPRDRQLRIEDLEYFRLDTAILWQTLTQNLPPLIPMLEEILKREK